MRNVTDLLNNLSQLFLVVWLILNLLTFCNLMNILTFLFSQQGYLVHV